MERRGPVLQCHIEGRRKVNMLKSYSFTWWQIGILKVAVLAIGVAIGAHWHELFATWITPLIVLGVVAGIYVAYVTLKQ